VARTNNEKPDWFFSHAGGVSELPHCPCAHKHNTLAQGTKCARGRRDVKSTHVREIRGGVAVADHVVREKTKKCERSDCANCVEFEADDLCAWHLSGEAR